MKDLSQRLLCLLSFIANCQILRYARSQNAHLRLVNSAFSNFASLVFDNLQSSSEKNKENKMATNTKDYGIIGKKIGMTQVFDDEGNVCPVTIIQLAENIITDIKTEARDGYNAIQVGAFKAKEKHITKADKNRFEKNGVELFRKTKEFRCHEAIEDVKVGDQINYEDFFKDLEKVNVTGTSIGKGFHGGVKLHNMSVGRRSHGSKSKRQIGSIGAGTDPSRVMKGKRMPAMMGNKTVTQMKAKVFKYDAEKNVVLIKGAVPGKARNTLLIQASGSRTWNNYNK